MKIVIYVDYTNVEFNKDFKIANDLIIQGHNVFLAVSKNQFNQLREKCDICLLGYSAYSKVKEYSEVVIVNDEILRNLGV